MEGVRAPGQWPGARRVRGALRAAKALRSGWVRIPYCVLLADHAFGRPLRNPIPEQKSTDERYMHYAVC